MNRLNYLKKTGQYAVRAIRSTNKTLRHFFGVQYALGFTKRTGYPYEPHERLLRGANVLIVGTGPSIDTIDREYFEQFDVAICINHAVTLKIPTREKFFFSTDFNRVTQIIRSENFAHLECIAKDRRIIVVDFTELSKFLLRHAGFFTWVRGHKYTFSLPFNPTNRPHPFYYVINDDYLIGSNSKRMPKYFLSKNSSAPININSRGSSAFQAMTYAARYKPKKIRLIGVDLDSGRASTLKSSVGRGTFGASTVERYKWLEEKLRHFGIDVRNDSWELRNA